MDRLSGLDASFLYLETPAQLMHVCGVIVLDPATMPGGYTFDALRDQINAGVRDVPAFTRKLRKVPMGLDHPVWVQDRHFAIDRHVHRLALPAPGGYEELTELTGHLAGLPLDRSRPLWEMWVIEGYRTEDGRDGVVVFSKMHHATVDGVSGSNLISHLCSLEPDAAPMAPEEPERHGHDPGQAELLGRAVVSNLARPLNAVRLVGPSVQLITRTIGRAREGTAMAAPFSAPRTSFNGTITGHRAIGLADLDLEDIRQVKNATGTTVNDVVLTVAGGALRSYLDERGELPSASLLATVPVSVREHVPARHRRQQGLRAVRQARHRHRRTPSSGWATWPSATGTRRTTTPRSARTRSRTGPSSRRRARSGWRCARTPACGCPSGTRSCTTWSSPTSRGRRCRCTSWVRRSSRSTPSGRCSTGPG